MANIKLLLHDQKENNNFEVTSFNPGCFGAYGEKIINGHFLFSFFKLLLLLGIFIQKNQGEVKNKK